MVVDILLGFAYNSNNRTQHASQRCEPRWVFLILWRNLIWEN